jgi:uncharacterized protein (TIGR02594 family)
MEVTAFDIAQRFTGTKEIEGSMDNPQLMAMLTLDNKWPEDDEVPWCSAFVNYVCWLLRLPRSKSLRARSWLNVGRGIPLESAVSGFDIVVLKRGSGIQPGPEVTDAPGHVGFYAGQNEGIVELLGGNQSDQVKVSRYPRDRILGVRRLLG